MGAKRTYTIAEAADLSGISRKALARRIERGSLRSVVRNGRRLIPRSELIRAGLLDDEGQERGSGVDIAGLPAPAAAPGDDAETALASLVRDLMERLERQANELAQFRALTVQAESLRADRELTDLRARLASLESRTAEEPQRNPGVTETFAPTRRVDSTRRDSAGLWLPPNVAAPQERSAAARRPRVPEPESFPAAERRVSRGVITALEAAFIVAVAIIAGIAQLRASMIVAAIALAWALVAAAELVAWHRRNNP